MTDPTERDDDLTTMSPQQKRLLLQRLLQQKSKTAKRFGMSIGQQGLWYAFRRDPESTAFNVFLPTRVVSQLNLDAIRKAIEYLVQRHPCLRTTFSDDGGVLEQTVRSSLLPEFTIIDAAKLDEDELRAEVLAQTQRPFDLETGPLLRLAVFERGSQDHVIVATTHHIVVDFWSLILVLTELREIYRSLAAGAQPSLPPPSSNYADFVTWQQKMLAGDQAERDWQHWNRTLDGAAQVINWVTDYERPASFTGRADVLSMPLSADVANRIKSIAVEQSTTTNAVVMAALQVFIARYTRQNDFLIGSPFSGRGHREYEQTVGFFVNMLPIRADLSDDPTFATLVRRAGDSFTTALEHESFPFAEIVRRVQPPRDPSRSPLFQVTCTFEKSHLREEEGRAGFLMPSGSTPSDVGGMTQESFFVPHPTCHYDMEFIFEQTDHGLRGMMCFCRDLFDSETAKQMAKNFSTLIQNLTQASHARLSQIAWEDSTLGRDSDRRNEPTNSPDRMTLNDMLCDSFQRHASVIALIADETSTTYEQLDRQSIAIARSLHDRGVGRGDLVPVIAGRGPASIIAILGVLRSGAAVIPIDAAHPAVAMNDLIVDASPKLVLMDHPNHRSATLAFGSDGVEFVIIDDLMHPSDSCDVTDEIETSSPEDLAYVIYTSGSTGRSKGVMIQHAAIANTIAWRSDQVSVSQSDRVLMLLSHQFDAGFAIALSTLAQGATLVWPTADTTVDIHDAIATIDRHRVTILPAVPSLLQLFISHPRFSDCRSIRQIWCGGESMPSDLPGRIQRQMTVRLWNFYGPTEAGVEATAHEVVDHDPKRLVPIGRPIANTDVIVLDEFGRVVPDTVPGQLAILGRGLAIGYLGCDEQTKSSFVTAVGDHPRSSRMYLTGDLGRRLSDGTLEFLGRIDHQVKLRGYRIELEEIESVLRMHADVANAAAKIIQPESSAAQIVAFVVPVPKSKPSAADEDAFQADLHRHLAIHLPSYKRPTRVQCLSELPLNASGKIDRACLPEPEIQHQTKSQVALPLTPLERHIAALWSELLAISNVGVQQNFFELGGSSLQAAIMTARLSEDFGVHVPTALVFDLADIASMAERLVSLHPDEMQKRFGNPTLADHVPRPHVDSHPLIASLRTSGNGTPIFMVHPPGGIVICYRELASHLESGRPLLAIRSRGLHGTETLPGTIEAMAADYVDAIRSVQPFGPYLIGGWSLGGVIAYEVAQQLIASNETIAKLILLDSTIPSGASELIDSDDTHHAGLEYGIDLSLQQLSELGEDDQLPFLWQHAVNLGVLDETSPKEVVQQVLRDLKHLFHHHVQLASNYRMQPINAPALLIRPTDVPVLVPTSPDRGWGRLVDAVDVRYVPGHHHSMVAPPNVGELARVIQESVGRDL